MSATLDLNTIMEMDHPVWVDHDGRVRDVAFPVYAPECFDDGEGGIDTCGDTDWTALTGYSGQDRYSGPIMHPSEYIGGALAEDILAEPGVYVAVVVDDPDTGEEPSGWAVMRYCGAELCPDCGRPIERTDSGGLWRHRDMVNPPNCWRLSLDGPYVD